MAHLGSLPCTAIEASSSGSTESRAVPATRTVSAMPGSRKISAISGFSSRFFSVSSRLLPGRSASAIVCSSSTLKAPGGSPRGVTSCLPDASAVATRQIGERAMKRPIWTSMRPMSFSAAPLPTAA